MFVCVVWYLRTSFVSWHLLVVNFLLICRTFDAIAYADALLCGSKIKGIPRENQECRSRSTQSERGKKSG